MFALVDELLHHIRVHRYLLDSRHARARYGESRSWLGLVLCEGRYEPALWGASPEGVHAGWNLP